MRAIHWAHVDKRRPVLVLTRSLLVGRLSTVTVAPITSAIHAIATEVPVGRRNGLRQDSVVKCDHIASIPVSALQQQCGWLFEEQELALHEAIRAAFDLT